MTRSDARRVARNAALLIGLGGVLVLAIVALFGAQLTASDPQAQRIVLFFPDGVFKVPPTPPDAYYPLGTDPLGRDQLARLLWGARLTFTVVLLALLLRTALALGVGLLSGWRRGGPIDALLTLVTNAVAGVPQLLLALLIAILLRDQAVVGFVVALGLVGWAESAQFVRSEVARIRRAAYVEAAIAVGGRTRGILTRHVMRGLAPQLFGLVALEAGGTLLLLAELGFLGVFMSGAAYLVDDANRPILPVRDRAPEWGQMLAGAQTYAFSNQYVAFVPGVVVAAAVFVFNLLGEGVRSATDPFSPLSLSPRALGALGRGLAAFALVSAAFFGIAEARTTELSFEDAMAQARAAALRVEPGAPLVAAVVRYSAESHGLARPEKYNFYFRSSGVTATLRVGFPDADQNAMEVKLDDEDGLSYQLMRPLETTADLITSTRALQLAEEKGGGRVYRTARTWLVRVVLSHDRSLPYPTYRVSYATPQGMAAPAIDLLLDARTGDGDSKEFRGATARLRAEVLLGGPVALAGVTARWTSSTVAGTVTLGAMRPASVSYSYVRPDLPNDTRLATVTFGERGSANVGSTFPRRQPLGSEVDIEEAFAAVERGGGAAVRAAWGRDWSANVSTDASTGRLQVVVSYFPAGNVPAGATFTFDVATGAVVRTR